MKVLVLVLAFLVVLQAGHLCQICIEMTEFMQSFLIHITPTFMVKDIVKSVCERQCISSPIQTSQSNYAKKWQMN